MVKVVSLITTVISVVLTRLLFVLRVDTILQHLLLANLAPSIQLRTLARGMCTNDRKLAPPGCSSSSTSNGGCAALLLEKRGSIIEIQRWC